MSDTWHPPTTGTLDGMGVSLWAIGKPRGCKSRA